MRKALEGSNSQKMLQSRKAEIEPGALKHNKPASENDASRLRRT